MADADLTVVYGVNHQLLGNQHIVSNASCTTNCLAPLAKVLHDSVGIKHGLMTTIHAYTNDQNLLDKNHSDLYRPRAAAHSMIPTSTGAAKAIGLVIPELDGRLDGLAVRVPTMNVSLVDLSFTASRNTSVAEINEILRAGARHYPEGVMECNEEALVSCDFNGYPVSSVADLTQTRCMIAWSRCSPGTTTSGPFPTVCWIPCWPGTAKHNSSHGVFTPAKQGCPERAPAYGSQMKHSCPKARDRTLGAAVATLHKQRAWRPSSRPAKPADWTLLRASAPAALSFLQKISGTPCIRLHWHIWPLHLNAC